MEVLNHLATDDAGPENGHPGTEESLHARVLALKGKKTYGLIAKELGLTRNQVAGIVFRNNHPYSERKAAAPGKGNKIGTGYRTGPTAKEHLPFPGGAVGRVWRNRKVVT